MSDEAEGVVGPNTKYLMEQIELIELKEMTLHAFLPVDIELLEVVRVKYHLIEE